MDDNVVRSEPQHAEPGPSEAVRNTKKGLFCGDSMLSVSYQSDEWPPLFLYLGDLLVMLFWRQARKVLWFQHREAPVLRSLYQRDKLLMSFTGLTSVHIQDLYSIHDLTPSPLTEGFNTTTSQSVLQGRLEARVLSGAVQGPWLIPDIGTWLSICLQFLGIPCPLRRRVRPPDPHQMLTSTAMFSSLHTHSDSALPVRGLSVIQTPLFLTWWKTV